MMPDHRNDTAATWFQRHPKKTLAAVTLIFILAIAFATEKFLEFNNRRKGIFLDQQEVYPVKGVPPRHPPAPGFSPQPPALHRQCLHQEYSFEYDKNGFIVPSQQYDRPDKVIVFLGVASCQSYSLLL